MEPLIQTARRARIPRGLSYPIGAEAITAALAGVTQFSKLELWFSCASPAHTLRVSSKSDSVLPIIQVTFEKISPGATGSRAGAQAGWYSDKWRLWVYAMPSEAKSRVRQALLDRGLAQVRAWLEAEREQTWLYGRHSFLVSARLSDGHLVGEEDRRR